MTPPGLHPVLEQTAGALLVLVVLLDVFMTVLYARIGTGILSRLLGRSVWRVFRTLGTPFGPRSGKLLSFCGPTILVALVVMWTFLLMLGTGLIMHPYLGTSVRTSSGPTPTDFVSALYSGGISVSIIGSSNFVPETVAFRLFYLFNSIVGVSVVSLTLTYLMQIYNALQARNTLGLRIHTLTGCTQDAAVLVAGAGPSGHFDSGYTNLASIAADLVAAKEAHHFYPVLFYFRFSSPFYSAAAFTTVALDSVSLIRSALNREQFGWLQRSAAVNQLWDGSLMLVGILETAFLHGGVPRPVPPDADTRQRWRGRYFAALRAFEEAGIATAADPQGGAEAYIALRTQWCNRIQKLAHSMLHSMNEIDPAGSALQPHAAEPPRPVQRAS